MAVFNTLVFKMDKKVEGNEKFNEWLFDHVALDIESRDAARQINILSVNIRKGDVHSINTEGINKTLAPMGISVELQTVPAILPTKNKKAKIKSYLDVFRIIAALNDDDEIVGYSDTIKLYLAQDSETNKASYELLKLLGIDMVALEEKSAIGFKEIESAFISFADRKKMFEFKEAEGKNTSAIKGIKPAGIDHIIKKMNLWTNTLDDKVYMEDKPLNDLALEILWNLKDKKATGNDPFPIDMLFTMQTNYLNQVFKSNLKKVTRDNYKHAMRAKDVLNIWRNGAIETENIDLTNVKRFAQPMLEVEMNKDTTEREQQQLDKFWKLKGITNPEDQTDEMLEKIWWDNITFMRNEEITDDMSEEQKESIAIRKGAIFKKSVGEIAKISEDPAMGPAWIVDWEMTKGQEMRKKNHLSMWTRAFTFNIKENYLFFVQGTGGSGKSTYLQIMSKLAGNSVNRSTLDKLIQDPNGFNASMIAGKTAALISELPATVIQSEKTALVKELTGGSDLQYSNKGKDVTTTHNGLSFIIEANKIPFFKDASSKAMDRRIKIITMENDVDRYSGEEFQIWEDVYTSNHFFKIMMKSIVKQWDNVIKDGLNQFDNEEWKKPFVKYKTDHNEIRKFILHMVYKANQQDKDSGEPLLSIGVDGSSLADAGTMNYSTALTDVPSFVAAYKDWKTVRGYTSKIHLDYLEEPLQEVMEEIDPAFRVSIVRGDIIRVENYIEHGRVIPNWWQSGVNIADILTKYENDIKPVDTTSQDDAIVKTIASLLNRLYLKDGQKKKMVKIMNILETEDK